MSPLSVDFAAVDGPDIVADHAGNAEAASTPSPQRRVDSLRPNGQPQLAGEVASRRRGFIRKFAASEGITNAVLEKRWKDAKNGYPVQYDKPFAAFGEWWDITHPLLQLSPSNIRPGLVAEYLRIKSQAGTHHDVLRDISTSISMACVEASDGKFQPGKSYTVTSFMEGERRQRPVRRKDTGEYADMALLYQEAWLYGPDSALTLGHMKERVVMLLMADTACRPSDLSKLYRVYEGWQCQMDFVPTGVKLRFFYPKEVVPGTSRDNATGYYFSSWVMVLSTLPVEISTPECLKAFVGASSGPDFASVHVPELDVEVQPLVYAKRLKGKLQPASVDHISGIMKVALKEAGMGSMTARSVRGASPSKVVQLFPELIPEALQLGRWTNRKTFNNHYQAPVRLSTVEPPPVSLKSNLQQILRWGFVPQPPPRISATDYMRGPDFWVGQMIPRLGKISSFDGGVYEVDGDSQLELYHYELMEAVSVARSS